MPCSVQPLRPCSAQAGKRGAAAGALGDLLPQALQKAFEKDASGNIKNEGAFKAANTIISAALTSATGSDIANTINAGMVTQNAVENNYLGHTQLQIMADIDKGSDHFDGYVGLQDLPLSSLLLQLTFNW